MGSYEKLFIKRFENIKVNLRNSLTLTYFNSVQRTTFKLRNIPNLHMLKKNMEIKKLKKILIQFSKENEKKKERKNLKFFFCNANDFFFCNASFFLQRESSVFFSFFCNA